MKKRGGHECVPKTQKELAIEKAKREANCGENQYPKYKPSRNKFECVDKPTKKKKEMVK